MQPSLDSEETVQSLRVMSYNIRHGQGLDEQIDLPRIAAVIREHSPDLVALQEIDRQTDRSAGVDQAAELGKLTGLTASFGLALPLQGGQYGNVVLSRYPVSAVTNHPLPHSPDREPRTAVACRVETPAGTGIMFISTHLDYLPEDPKDRLAQVREINERLGQDDDLPAIIAGDFNADPDSAPLNLLRECWYDATGENQQLTFPADFPTIRIDHIFVRPARRWQVLQVEVINEPLASDHRPILAVLQLR